MFFIANYKYGSLNVYDNSSLINFFFWSTFKLVTYDNVILSNGMW
jgi:hypothetical protein